MAVTPLEFLRRAMEATPASAANHITARLLACLLVLDQERKPIRLRHLADALGIPKPSTTRLSQSLARLGFARREHNGKDKRDCWLTITPEGHAFVAHITYVEKKAAA